MDFYTYNVDPFDFDIALLVGVYLNKKLQQTTKNTFGPGNHFPDDQSIRIYILWAIRFALIQI